MHWEQYKFSFCVLCREVVLFSEVQIYLIYRETNYLDPEKCPLYVPISEGPLSEGLL